MRAPLRLLAGAFAATAALVFLQTLVLRAVPYDASWFGALSAFFRVLFIATDVGAVVALVLLTRSEPAVYPFTTTASVVLGLSVACGLLGFAVSAFGGVEPVLSFGATLLVVLALAAVLGGNPVPDRRRTILMGVALSAAVIVLAMRIASATSRDAVSMTLAWIRWALAVAQPAALAAIAWIVSRAKEAEHPSAETLAAAGGGGGAAHYRDAGHESMSAAHAGVPPPSPAIIDPLRVVASGIALQRTGFLVRACSAGGILVFAIVGVPLLALFLPLVGGATAIMMAVGVSRQRALATFGGTWMRTAYACFVAAAVGDFGGLLVLTIVLSSHSMMGFAVVGFIGATIAAGLGILSVSRAHERAGDLLYKYRLAALARWTQSFLVALVSTSLAMLASAAHRGSRGSDLGPMLGIGFGFLTFGIFIAVIITHVMTLNEAARVVAERLDKAVAAASHPNQNP
jgi:hypothetical protein